jgi:transcriptional regulator with XRE-family HTH domain
LFRNNWFTQKKRTVYKSRGARKAKGVLRQELAVLAKVRYTNARRYERGGADPSTDILNRIAKDLKASPDSLVNGTLQDKYVVAIDDEEPLTRFRKIEKSASDKRKIIKELINAFISKADLQKQPTQWKN